MPNLQIDLWKGIDNAIKEKLITEITDVVLKVIGCPKHAVHIIIREEPKENWATGGETHAKLHADKKPCSA
jgi:4-oxalocrotonate tautomerase